MLARITSYGLTGLLGYPVTVETDISFGFAGYETVGLPDNAVKESKEPSALQYATRAFLSQMCGLL